MDHFYNGAFRSTCGLTITRPSTNTTIVKKLVKKKTKNKKKKKKKKPEQQRLTLQRSTSLVSPYDNQS